MYTRMLVVLFISLYTSRVVLANLGITDFGIYNAVAGVSSMLSFFTSSLSNASQRYLSFELGKKDFEGANRIFNLSIILFFILCLFLLFALESLGIWLVNYKMVIPDDRMFAANVIFQFSIILCVLSIMQVPFQSCIIAEERMEIYAYLGIFDVIAKLIIVLILPFSTCDKLIIYGFLFLCVQLIVFLIYYFYCAHNFIECKFHYYWEKKLAYEMLSFISYNAVGCFSWSFAYQGATVVLNIFFGPVINAARGIAMQINASLNNFTTGIVTAIKPQIVKSYASKDYHYMEQLILFSSKYSLLLFLLLAFPIIANIDFVLSVWLEKIPPFTNIFAVLILVDSMVAVLLNPITIAINSTGKIKNIQLYGRLITLSSIPLSFLIYEFEIVRSPTAIFYVLILAELGYWLYGLWDMHNKINISYYSYFKEVVFGAVILILICICVNIWISDWYLGWLGFVFKSVINIIMVFFLGGFLVVNKNEREWLLEKAKKILKRYDDKIYI